MQLVQKRMFSLLGLVAVAGGAAYFAFWQTEHAAQRDKEAAQKTKVLAFAEPAAAQKITLTSAAAGALQLERVTADGKSSWSITAPVRTPAESETVDALLQHVAELKRTAVVGAKDGESEREGAPPPDLELFGLARPRFTLAISDAKGATETLLCGKKSSFDGSLYVKREGAAAVFVVPGALEYQLDKDLYKLRDKRLVAFDPEAVASLRVHHGAVRYALEKDGENYRLIEPRTTPADGVAVSALVSALSSANAKAFISESATAEELRRHGFSKPAVEVELALRTGAPKRLLIAAGTGKDEKPYYATVAGGGGPIIELAGNWLVEKLTVTADDLRDKRVLVFEREDVSKVSLRKGEAALTLVREKAGESPSWNITVPEQAKAQDAEVTSLLYRLWNLKAKRIASETATPADRKARGLDTPALTVTLEKADGTAIGTMVFGQIEGEDQYVTATPGGRIDVVEKSAAEEVAIAPAKYKEEPNK